MRSLFLFFTGTIIGMALVVVSLPSRERSPFLGSLLTFTGSDRFARCPADVDTSKWQTFKSNTLGFEVHFPSTYAAVETSSGMTLAQTNTATGAVRTTIVFEKIHEPFDQEVTTEMRQASWKIADRQTYALTTPYFTNDDTDLQSLSERYLFIRDFPQKLHESLYSMTRATITMGKDSLLVQAARQANIIDPEEVLTEPEQILSTFRFLQYDELPGRDTGVPHGV